MAVFSHGGKFGDLIYALPAVKALGGGHLVLYPNPGTGMTFTPDLVENVRPLLERQPYVESVRFAAAPQGLNLDTYRQRWNGNLNIADIVSAWLNLPLTSHDGPWLENVAPEPVARVVFSRCPRYHNGEFPWEKAVAKYGREAVFLGTADEHRAFADRFGAVPHHPTPDLYAVARAVAGADLCVMNQSSPRAIAEGLKRPLVQETCRHDDNCHWARPGAVYGYRSDVPLPDLPPAAAGGSGRAAALAGLVPFRAFTAAHAAEQAAHLDDWHHLYRPGQPRYICSVLGAVWEQLADRPDLRHLVLEAVWMARRMNDAGTGQERLDWGGPPLSGGG